MRIPLRSGIDFYQNLSFRLRKTISSQDGCVVVVTFWRLIFVRRRGGRAMSPSPLCGGIVVFQFYPHKNQCKIAWARVGGVWGVSCFPLGCSGWLPGVLLVCPGLLLHLIAVHFYHDICVETVFLKKELHVWRQFSASMGHAGITYIIGLDLRQHESAERRDRT